MGAYIPPTITTLLVPTKAPKQTKEGKIRPDETKEWYQEEHRENEQDIEVIPAYCR
jgi:hypothetical protein